MWDWLPTWKKEKFDRLIKSYKIKEYGWGYEHRKRRLRIDFAHSKRKKEHYAFSRFEAIKEKWKFPMWKKKSRRHFDG